VLALTLSDKLGVNVNVDYVKAPTNVAPTTSSGVPAWPLRDQRHLNVAAASSACAHTPM
jgi:hypothetical protein